MQTRGPHDGQVSVLPLRHRHLHVPRDRVSVSKQEGSPGPLGPGLPNFRVKGQIVVGLW